MPSTTTNLCQAKASYKKTHGLLELTKSNLQWTANGKQTPDVRVPINKAISLFCSKDGSAQVKLKLALIGDDVGHTFMFTAPQAVAEREVFKKELTLIISTNRAAASGATEPPSPVPGGQVTSKGSTPRPLAATSSRAASASSNDRASSSAPTGPQDDFQLRKKVLVRNKELATLHKELVMSGQITESEFWEGRESLLNAEAAQENQKRGKPGQLVDPRPESVAGGDIKIVITPQLVHDIFDEYPVVAKVYNETVPNQLSEADFWKRYFQSKLFNSHRASIRSSATQHVIKEDPIFDKYVEKDDDEIEPKHQRDNKVDVFINLYATQEDHGDTGNQKDTTMQAGRQRGALPLIRKFNEHSERLLNAAEGTPTKKRRLNENEKSDIFAQIELEDLHDGESNTAIILEMKDRDRYFEGRTANSADKTNDHKLPMDSVLSEIKHQVDDWSKSLSALRVDKKAGDMALQSMTDNVQARLAVKLRKNDIPEDILQQMRTCQTAANEFLRQFWSSVFPSPADGIPSGSANAAQKAAKAAKMAGYLTKTPEKVKAIVQTAHKSGLDATKIEVAMNPVLVAVEKALQFYKTRRTAR